MGTESGFRRAIPEASSNRPAPPAGSDAGDGAGRARAIPDNKRQRYKRQRTLRAHIPRHDRRGNKRRLASSPGYLKMNPVMREGVEMIAHKIARCCAGDPYEPDHWLDIQGYAALVHARVAKPVNTIEDDIKSMASRHDAGSRDPVFGYATGETQ